MNLPTEELEFLLKTEKLKYVSRDGNLYEYSDLVLNEDLNKQWKQNRSSFLAKKYWVKPNIKPGSVFTAGTYGDIWVRFNCPKLMTTGNCKGDVGKFDIKCLIIRKASNKGKDLLSDGSEMFWEESWPDFVMGLTDEDWKNAGPTLLKEGLSDEKLYSLLENPPLGKTDEEILELLE